MSSLPAPRYSLWQAVSAALAVALRAIDEVRALSRQPGPQGERGTTGEKGRDGLGFDDLEQFEDERSYGIVFRRDGQVIKELRWKKATLADCYDGVWKEGEHHSGDVATWEGSLFIAQRDTSTKPGTPNSDWRLAVKRGRDGKDGTPGKTGERGMPGTPGRDGQKW